MRLLDRYILSHLLVPFFIGVLLFVLILLGEVAYHIGSTIVGGRVSALLIIKYLMLRAPRALVWSLPFGCLLGVSMTISGLAHHGELTAIRAGGAPMWRICASALALGVLASGAGIVMNRLLVPPTMQAAERAVAEMMQSQPVVNEAYDQYFRDEAGRFYYVGEMRPAENLLRRVMIWERDDHQRLERIIAAESAELSGNIWTLRDGAVINIGEQGEMTGPAERFSTRTVQLARALQDYYAERRTPAELAPHELLELINVRRQTGSETHQMEVYLHFKYSIPLACLVFVLIAAPLAGRYARYGTYTGVLLAIVVVFLYNGVRSWTLAFGLAGTLSPVAAGWTPDVLFGILGVLLMFREP
ncbi:MAG TPA: LptF/LptG family permease [Armatimonadota bacterium]|nr:LptF/LptG family permease [Armatimonadota bacterium]